MMGYAPSPTLQNEASLGHILWQAGDEVVVNSPMALLNNEQLKIRTVTWTQDRQSGTQTLVTIGQSARSQRCCTDQDTEVD